MEGIRRTLLLSLCIASVHSETLWDAVMKSDQPIGKFRDFLKEVSGIKAFINFGDCTTECPVLFIPSDSAFEKHFPKGFKGESAERQKIVFNHLGYLLDNTNSKIPALTAVFDNPKVVKKGKSKDYVIVRNQLSGKIFWVRKKGAGVTYFVNNAELGAKDVNVAGGVYHVIHDFIFPLAIDKDPVTYMNDDKVTYSEFLDIFNAYVPADDLLFDGRKLKNAYTGNLLEVSSIFVPQNEAFADIPDKVKTELKTNQTKAFHFLLNHVAGDEVVFINWMKTQSKINLSMGNYVSSKFSYKAQMYSQNNGTSNYIASGGVTAAISSDEGQPLKNTVLFKITKALGLLYNTLRIILQQKASAFLSRCDSVPSCKALIDGGNCTVIAPAQFVIPSTFNTTLLKKILLLHIIQNTHLTTPEMTMGKRVEIPDIGVIRFTPGDKNTMMIDGRLSYSVGRYNYKQGFVGSTVTSKNEAALNGMVQVILTPLGYATKSIFELLNSKYVTFSRLVGFLSELDIDLKTVPANGQHYTLFAPTNAAIKKMADDLGDKVLNDKTKRNGLLKRLLLPNTVILSNLEQGKVFSYDTFLPYYNDPYGRAQLHVSVQLNREKVIEAAISEQGKLAADASTVKLLPHLSEWGCTNGIVYAIDTVPYNSATIGRVCKPNTVCDDSATNTKASLAVVTATAGLTMLLYHL